MLVQSDIAAERRKNVATAEGRGRRFEKKHEPLLGAKVLLHCNFEMVCERPPRSLSPSRGGDYIFSPSVRGRAAEGGRGSLKHHLESDRPYSVRSNGVYFS
jgi:hypothetical protein